MTSNAVGEPNTLFTPLKIGNITLSHRVVMAPLTRYRATAKSHIPLQPMVSEYYDQRSTRPGTLIITEATVIAPEAGGYDSVPGIWSEEQMESWKKVVDRIHKNNCFVFLQLWALGRAAKPEVLMQDGPYPYVSASNIPLPHGVDKGIRPLTVEEINRYVDHYAQAAENAVKVGFDGVEIHGANGYLIDQFLQDVTNKRTDAYGGSIENRSRFGLQVINAIVERIGAERTAIRLSPFGTFQGMGMTDPHPQFIHFVSSLPPNLAYLHVVEARYSPLSSDVNAIKGPRIDEALNFLRDIWYPRPFLSVGNFDREKALQHFTKWARRDNEAVVFGRWFISNPDLPERLEQDLEICPYDRSTFYTPGSPVGYIDYPFANGIRAKA